MNFDNMDEIELEIDLKGKNQHIWMKLMTQIKHTTWMKLMHKGTIPYHTWMKLHMEEDDEQNYKNVVQVSGLRGQLG